MTLWLENAPVDLNPQTTESESDDLQVVIRAVYRQVLGNSHVLDSDRLKEAESKLRNRNYSIRDFVRAVALSDLYRTRFFEMSSPYRFIELNFKHLLGRAPQDQAEISEHVQIYCAQGYECEINSYIDSEEYFACFGENQAPYTRGSRTQLGLKNVGFNRLFALDRGFAANDVGTSAKLIRDLGGNLPTKIVPPAKGSGTYSNLGKRFRVSVVKVSQGSRPTKTTAFDVSFSQLSQRIQTIHKTGGIISSINEVC